MRWNLLRRAACTCGLALMVAVGTARAGSFQVDPVKLTLTRQKPVGVLHIRNTGTQPTVVQVEVKVWSQGDGSNSYAAAPEVLATPPIVRLAPGAVQVIRVGLRHPAAGTNEQAYRVFLREVPPPPEPGFKGLRMALRISIPMFVPPATPGKPVLQWHLSPAPNGKLRISVTNQGTVHAHLSQLALQGAGASALPMPESVIYVLAGATRTWLVDAHGAIKVGQRLHLSARGDDAGPIQANLVVKSH